jgi:hypothetical protein
MHSQEYGYAYYEAPPIDLSKAGWRAMQAAPVDVSLEYGSSPMFATLIELWDGTASRNRVV